MNKKLLIGGAAVAAFFFLGGKKSKKPSVKEDVPGGEGLDDYEGPDEEEPEPAPQQQPKVDDKWKNLSQFRRNLADLWINDTPLQASPANIWSKYAWGDYNKWKKPGNDNYLDWLTNQIYWDLTVDKEKTTDIYTPPGELNINYSSKHPFLLKPGIKAEVMLKDKWFDIYEVKLNESTADAKKRLAEGVDLWLQLKSYVKNRLKYSDCPQGVICK